MNTKHTAGPWVWNEAGGYWVLWGNYGQRPVVLAVTPDGRLELRDKLGFLAPFTLEHPDAKLIAAAPELLDALQALVSALDSYRCEDTTGTCRCCACLPSARAAIAKATGVEVTA